VPRCGVSGGKAAATAGCVTSQIVDGQWQVAAPISRGAQHH